MKRIISIALVALMLVALALPVIAALPEGSTISSNKQDNHLTNDVTVTVQSTSGGEITPVYSVYVEWNGLDFTYNATWNAEQQKYVGSWNNDGEGTVTVTNKSNASVYITATFGDEGSIEKNGVTATLAEASEQFELISATAEEDEENVKSKEYTVTVTGEPTVENFTVGTVEIDISTTPAAND